MTALAEVRARAELILTEVEKAIVGKRKPLELIIQYALEQKIIPRRIEVEELFDDATRGLSP